MEVQKQTKQPKKTKKQWFRSKVCPVHNALIWGKENNRMTNTSNSKLQRAIAKGEQYSLYLCPIPRPRAKVLGTMTSFGCAFLHST